MCDYGRNYTYVPIHVSNTSGNKSSMCFIRYSSTVVKRQPSLSFVPSYTGIVATPSITESLTSKPLLMTSSLTESLNVSITSIQASETTRFLLTSTTLSLPVREKLKKLKQGMVHYIFTNVIDYRMSPLFCTLV